MGGQGSGGSRSKSGRLPRAAAAARDLGRSQPSMRAFTTRDPIQVQEEADEQETAPLQQLAVIEAARLIEVERSRRQEEKRKEAIKILKKVMGEGGLEETLGLLPDDLDDDDDDDDDNDDDDYYEDDNNNGQDNNVPKIVRKSIAYKPPKKSSLDTYLRGIKDEILDGNTELRDKVIINGQHFIPPQFDPVASANPTNPESWYLGDVWCFFWDPFLQHKLDMKTCVCTHCGKKTIEPREYDWRPFFWFDKIVWVIFRRLRCGNSKDKKGCGKSPSSFDPVFMSTNVPTTIAETFPFIATKRGPGMHQMMLYSFAELVTNRVQFGTFANIFNSLYRMKYDMSRKSYYSLYKNRRDQVTTLGGKMDVPTPYGRYETVGEYNGLRLTRSLVKRIFFQFMDSHEKYFQASFQMRYALRKRKQEERKMKSSG